MYRKCISIIVALCLLALGGYAFGAVPFPLATGPGSDDPFVCWHAFQDDWHNSATDLQPPATVTDGCDWHEAAAWGAHKNVGAPVPAGRPPDSNVWACIEPKTPGPNIVGDIRCVRFSILPWSWDGVQGFVTEFKAEAGDINCGLMLDLAGKASFNSFLQGYPILNMYGGRVFTPGIPNITNWETHEVGSPSWWDGWGLQIGGGEYCWYGTAPCYGTVNMYGGMMDLPKITIWYGDVNLYGGLLYHNNTDNANFTISLTRSMNRIYVYGPNESYPGGELRLKGDRRERVWYYVDHDERICPCAGHGVLSVDYNGTDTSVTAVCTWGSAWNPMPKDRTARVELSPPPTLTWSPGLWTQNPGSNNAHAVYFGMDFNDVNDANDQDTPGVGAYKGRQDPCSYALGELVSDTVYYWRIDEYNDAGDPCHPGSPWKGNVWWFKTKGPVSGDPKPADGTVGLSIPLQLSWSAGALTQDVDGHILFFGPDKTDVCNATIDIVPSSVRKYTLSPTVFPLSTLDYNLAADTNYYWRVDEVNDTNLWTGEVWMFRNTNYFIIDDFENYDSDEELLTRWTMNDYESCPYYYPAGEIVWVYALPGEERGIGSMRYDYDDYHGSDNCGSCHFSEVRFDANGSGAGGEDWTGGGALPDNDKARSLAISYIGVPDNDADPNYDTMYVAIEDTGSHFGSIIKNSTEAQRMNSWQQWNVNLTDLNSPDVNLKAVKYLYLGFGIRCNGGLQGGTGTVRFDDIRLYQRQCVPEYGPAADLSGDCRVDINDVNMFADQWFAKQQVLSVKEPCNIDANLMLWYKFDETGATTTVTDSSGNGHNGEVNNAGPFDPYGSIYPWDATGGYDGNGCINLGMGYNNFMNQDKDCNTYVEANVAALLDANGHWAAKHAITFSVWINADAYMPRDDWPRLVSIFQDFNEMNDVPDLNEVVEIECPTPEPPTWNKGPLTRFVLGPIGEKEKREVNEVNALTMKSSDFSGQWNHYAFVKDADANLMRIYHNGGLIAEHNTTTALMLGDERVEAFRIGRRRTIPYLHNNKTIADQTWVGRIDDFRVYNYALSQAEAAWLGTRGTGIVPFDNVANFKESSVPEAVDFGDYAILAQQWLNQQLWP